MGLVKRKEDDDASKSNAQKQQQQEKVNNQSPNNYAKQQFPNGQKTSIDYSRASVNISQIVTDFRNTTNAIAAPQDIQDEVNTYLHLIESQAEKEFPNSKIIQANLKIASQILDEYITKTLKKHSTVVENWIDALFLQKIEYKANPESVNPDFKVQLPPKKEEKDDEEGKEKQSYEETNLNDAAVNNPLKAAVPVYLPQDEQIRKLFIKGKKYASVSNTEKALDFFEKALNAAREKDDKQAQPLIYFEIAKIYDDHDLLAQALTLYNKASTSADSSNVKTKAHFLMAKIYDEAGQFQPAMEHYYTSIGFAGEEENLKAQTSSLTKIGNMYASKYNAQGAKTYFESAQDIAKETGETALIAKTYRKTAEKMSDLNETTTALNYLKQSGKYYSQAQNPQALANVHEQAADLMIKLGNKSKAASLMKKAGNIYKQEGDVQKAFETETQIIALSA